MSLQKHLNELQEHGIISADIARKIEEYYRGKEASGPGILFLTFGILGAILVGLGIILILAHNWDSFSRTFKILLAFTPLLIGQVTTALAIWKMKSRIWTESTSAFLLLAVGACIALISQIYHISGDLEDFMLVWVLLTLPLFYLSGSISAFVLLLCGITFYGCLTGYGSPGESYTYWWLIGACLPFYLLKTVRLPLANSTAILHWAISLSVVVVLGSLPAVHDQVLLLTYTSLFGFYYLVGSKFFAANLNAYTVSGLTGLLIMLLILSFSDSWESLTLQSLTVKDGPAILGNMLLVIGGLAVLVKGFSKSDPFSFAFLVVLAIFFISEMIPIAPLLINLLILGLGIWAIREGARSHHLGKLNGGLVMLSALILCRFFDGEFSFVARGLSFLVIGLGFFVANYLMLKKKGKS